MSFDKYRLKVIIYGKDQNKIDNIAKNLKYYSIEKVILSHDPKDKESSNENNIVLRYLKNSPQLMFINADTMKRNNICGIDNLCKPILKCQDKSKNAPYVVLFNRYLDSNLQTHYLGEIDHNSEVSIFQSFNPGNSDAYYMSEKCVEILKSFACPKEKYNSKKTLFALIREGKINAFSFNPNLYVYRLEGSTENVNIQNFKSSIVKYDYIMENRKLDRNISLFFSDHIILFWIFIVFFICTIFILFSRIFKIGSYFL